MKIGNTIISSVEFHGNMSLVIFLAECPLRCPYCHNAEILESEDNTDIKELYEKIDIAHDFIDAVNISGGEPLVQTDETIKILKYAKEKGLKTKLDTSGIYPKQLEKILNENIVDYVALDVKAPFNKYKEVINTNIGENVKKSMEIINKHNVLLECRTTYVPLLLNEEDVINIAKSIKCDIYTLQQFRNRIVLDDNLKEVADPNPLELKELALKIKPLFNNTTVKLKTAEFGEQEI